MTKIVRTHRLAEDELTDAAMWYETKQTGLGFAFLDIVDDAIARFCSGRILGGPVPGVRAAKSVRRILLKRFPYSIIFSERKDEIVVISLAHASRQPGYWRSRKL